MPICTTASLNPLKGGGTDEERRPETGPMTADSGKDGNKMKYHVIAIEREFASGGQQIGTMLGERLGIPCYGREILKMAAKEKGPSLEYLEGIEEKATGSVLYSMYMIASMTNIARGSSLSSESELFLTESEIIRRLTQTPAVIVGRCAVDALKDRADVLRVFIHGGIGLRRQRAVDVYKIDPANVDNVLRRADKRRAGFYKANTGCSWNDMNNYHIVLDSGLLGIERCVDILETCVR